MPNEPLTYDRNRLVVFDLPFALQLPNTDHQEIGGEIYVKADPPGSIVLVTEPTPSAEVLVHGVLEGGDPYGRVSFTRVQVRFHVATSPAVEAWGDEELVVEAVDRINILIDHYRDITNNPLVRRVSHRHLIRFRIVDEHPGTEPEIKLRMYGEGPLRVGIGEREEGYTERLRARLQSVDPPRFLRLLELDIDARLSIGETRQAVVDAGTMFETWLRAALEGAFALKGYSPGKIARQFLDNKGRPLSIRAIARKKVVEATGYDFGRSGPGFDDWDVRTRDLRNRVVHSGLAYVSHADAAAAVAAAHAAIKCLRDNAGLV